MPQQEAVQNVPGVAQSPTSSAPSLAPNNSNPQTDRPYPWPSTSPPLDQPKTASSSTDLPRPAHSSPPRRRRRRSQSHLPNLNQHMEIDLIGLLFTDPSHVSFPTYREHPTKTILVSEHEPHPPISRPPRQEAARSSTPTSAPALTSEPSELEHAGMDHDTYHSTAAVPTSNENSKHDFNDPLPLRSRPCTRHCQCRSQSILRRRKGRRHLTRADRNNSSNICVSDPETEFEDQDSCEHGHDHGSDGDEKCSAETRQCRMA